MNLTAFAHPVNKHLLLTKCLAQGDGPKEAHHSWRHVPLRCVHIKGGVVLHALHVVERKVVPGLGPVGRALGGVLEAGQHAGSRLLI